MNIFPIPFSDPKNILIMGAGGGFDFACGLPILFELEASGHTVHIGNYSFTDLNKVSRGEWLSKALMKINADSYHSSAEYFPEKHLSTWFRQMRGVEKDVWCLGRHGVLPTLEAYNLLVERLDIDTVICVDGGVDGIFRGDETDLGTPSMDSISVIAASLCTARQKIYCCTAFGVEGAEGGVSHAQALRRIADLVRQDAMLGVSSALQNTPAGKDFNAAVRFIHQQMKPTEKSTIVSSILAAMSGACGRTAVNAKTEERQPWLSPLTAMYWYFKAEEVAKLKLFYAAVLSSQTVGEVAAAIEAVRQQYGIRPYENIPI